MPRAYTPPGARWDRLEAARPARDRVAQRRATPVATRSMAGVPRPPRLPESGCAHCAPSGRVVRVAERGRADRLARREREVSPVADALWMADMPAAPASPPRGGPARGTGERRQGEPGSGVPVPQRASRTSWRSFSWDRLSSPNLRALPETRLVSRRGENADRKGRIGRSDVSRMAVTDASPGSAFSVSRSMPAVPSALDGDAVLSARWSMTDSPIRSSIDFPRKSASDGRRGLGHISSC